MNTGIHIGNNVDKKVADALVDSICRILKVAGDTRTDEATTRHALDVLVTAFKVENVTVHGCSFAGKGE